MRITTILTFFIGLQLTNGEWIDDLSQTLSKGLSEGTPNGAFIGTLVYGGLSTGESVTYSTTSNYFNVNSTTGAVTLAIPLVYRETKSLPVTFVAKVTNRAEDARSHNVTILPINHPPIFDSDTYGVPVQSTAAVGSVIYNSITVNDTDEGLNGTVSVQCVNASNADVCGFFNVRSEKQDVVNRVTVTLAKTLNSSWQSYPLTIRASDSGNPPLSDEATLTVTVEAIEDTRPTFPDAPIILQISEFAPLNSNLATVRVRDRRPSAAENSLIFQIANDSLQWFRLGMTTVSADGTYNVAIMPNRNISLTDNGKNQRYIFILKAVQMLSGQITQVSSQTVIAANIMDVNNHAPTFGQSNYAVSVSEGLTNGATVAGLSIVVYDDDLGDNSYFELSVVSNPSPVPGIFGLVPTNGQGQAAVAVVVNRPEYVRFTNNLPRSYVLTLSAVETRTVERKSGTTTVNIQVISTVNHPPYFPNILNPIVIPDSTSLGTIISNNIMATDDDPGNNGVLTYSIIDSDNATIYFSINPQTGVLALARQLNATIQSRYSFYIVATDNGGLSASLSLLINVVDSRKLGPQFPQPFYVTNCTEMTTNLFPPVTIRPTLEGMKHDRVIACGLSREIMVDNVSIFTLSQNGTFTMNKGVDYMNTPNKLGYFDVEVQCRVVSYPEIPTSTVIVRVYIMDTNNHAPYFLPLNKIFKTTIPDSTPPSTSIVLLNGTDDDTGNNAVINYFIWAGAQDNFIIDRFSGILSVSRIPRLKAGTTYNITVIAEDSGRPPLTGTTTVYVTVTDSVSRPPVFQFVSYTFYVIEGSSQGLVVGTATAISPDPRAIIAYDFWRGSWKAYNPSDVEVKADVSNWFSLNSTTAQITVLGNIVYATAVKVTVVLRARVTNPEVAQDLSTSVNVTIFILRRGENTDVVRFNPSTDFFYIQIYEQLPVNTQIYQFQAFYYATSTPVTNFILYNQTQNYLSIDQSTGVLRIKNFIYYSNLDPTKNLTCYLIATAPVPSSAKAGATVVVNILPLPDSFSFSKTAYDFRVYSNESIGYKVGQLSIITGLVNPNINYRLDPPSNIFQVANGSILLVRRLDEPNSPLQYTLRAVATVYGSNQYYAETFIRILVMPVRSQPPRFTKESYKFDAIFNSTATIGQVQAYDPDPFNSTAIKYAIVSTTPDSGGAFSIDPATGMITMNSKPGLGFNYTLNVSATDSSSSPLTSYASVNVTINRVSLDRPNFVGLDNTVFSVYYGNPYQVILKVNGSTPIPGRTISYSVDTSSVPSYIASQFVMNSQTGELILNGPISGSVSENYTLYLVISDGVSSTSKDITVGLYSNAAPTFKCKTNPVELTAPDYSRDPLSPSLGITINTPCSYDKPGTQFHYILQDGTLAFVENYFAIDSSTGLITPLNTMDAYLLNDKTLKVVVARNKSAVDEAKLNADAWITGIIKLTGRTARRPTFDTSNPYCPGTGSSLQRGVLDLSAPNTPIVRVKAGNCDMTGFNAVTYRFKSINFQYYANTEARDGRARPEGMSEAFAIDSNSGQVLTRLEDLRPFYDGYFTSKIAASSVNDASLQDEMDLLLYMLRENQMMMVVFNKPADAARNQSEAFLRDFNMALKGTGHQVLPSPTTFYVNPAGERDFSKSSMCYVLLKDDSRGGYYVTTDLTEVDRALNRSRFTSYDVANFFHRCFSTSTSTTKWWSGKWFLWFILIAVSILVFVVALLLTCCVCFYWPINLKEISKSRPYLVFDNQPTSAAGSFVEERW